ncbi:hypothetical protein ACLOJK_040284 [Asimina triloba]
MKKVDPKHKFSKSELGYFAALQHELKHYDCVLYEMVASRESLENRKNAVTKKPKDSRNQSFNIIGCLQRLMAHVLTLDFQLDCLDYEGKNWYHADLDYETFKSRQSERGENFFTFARDMTLRSAKAVVEPSIPEDLEPWKSKLLWASRVLPMPLVGLLIIGSVCTQSENSALEYPELEALSRLDFGAAMKVFLAKRLTSEFKLGPTAAEEGSVIIGERNKAISDGHNKIAILYGGGHMPDLGRRLREELDLTPSQVQWITAWSIRNRELDMQSFPFLRTLAKISGWPLNRYQTLGLLIFSAVLAVDLWFWELFVGTVVNWTALVAAEVVQFAENMQIIRQSEVEHGCGLDSFLPNQIDAIMLCSGMGLVVSALILPLETQPLPAAASPNDMMLLYQLPRLSSPFSISISKKLAPRTFPSFFSTISCNPTSTLSPTSLASASNCSSPVTSLSQLSQIQITRNSVFFDDDQVEFHPDSEVPEETQIEVPFEKLFIPPGVEVSGDKSALSRRVLKGSNIVLSDYAADAQISQAEFVKSSKRTADCPSDGLPEFALVGRSNVGKSSLLNSLVRRKRLALTSKKPGSSLPKTPTKP